MNPYNLFPFFSWLPTFPVPNNKPPTIYAILNSIVNYDSEEQSSIYELASKGRSKIFDFNYPLADNIKKEDFEVMILNHFIMRRIGFETVTIFKLQLNVTLNSIMPYYNQLFQSLQNFNLLESGEVITRILEDNKNIDENITSVVNSTDNSTIDERYSDTPENQIQNVKDGSYITDYTYNQNNSISDSDSTSDTNRTEKQNANETITRSPADKINILKQYTEKTLSIYNMIYKDLESLFYQII